MSMIQGTWGVILHRAAMDEEVPRYIIWNMVWKAQMAAVIPAVCYQEAQTWESEMAWTQSQLGRT